MRILEKDFVELKYAITDEEVAAFEKKRIENEKKAAEDAIRNQIISDRAFDSFMKEIKAHSGTTLVLNPKFIKDVLQGREEYKILHHSIEEDDNVPLCGKLGGKYIHSSHLLDYFEMDLFVNEYDSALLEKYPQLYRDQEPWIMEEPEDEIEPIVTLNVIEPKEADIDKENAKIVRIKACNVGNSCWYFYKVGRLYEVIPHTDSNKPYTVMNQNPLEVLNRATNLFFSTFEILREDCEVVKDVAPVKTNSRYDLIRRK
jgi:hypothetical protein